MRATWLMAAYLLSSTGTTPSVEVRPVVVFAAASLKEAVSEIAEQWSLRTGRKVRLQFDASSTLARQIRAGAQADVFLTADPEWLDAIETARRFDWMANRLVCVVPRETGEFDIRRAASLALAGEQVPAGRYGRAALRALDIPLPKRVILGASVRDVLAKVSQGGAEAGIVYATDAAVDSGVRVAFTFPLHSHPRIVYAAGLLDHAGGRFFDALREPWAKEIVRRHGFVVPQ